MYIQTQQGNLCPEYEWTQQSQYSKWGKGENMMNIKQHTKFHISLAALKVMHVNTCLQLLHASHKTMESWISAAQLVSMPHTGETQQQEAS